MFDGMKRKIDDEGEVIDCSPESEAETHTVYFSGSKAFITADRSAAERAYNALVLASKGLAKFGLKYPVKIESDRHFRHN